MEIQRLIDEKNTPVEPVIEEPIEQVEPTIEEPIEEEVQEDSEGEE